MFGRRSVVISFQVLDESMVGSTVSHYKIVSEIGRGGMGVVYKAEDVKLGRMVALKFLPPHLTTDSTAKARFIQEARAASRLDHPNICTIYEIGEVGPEPGSPTEVSGGQVFIAMACYDGETLKEKITDSGLPIDQAVDYAAQIAEGMARAHEAGIVHRDVKPANVMVTDRDVVKILDFGLAKVSDMTLTRTGRRLGTVVYMSPEQARGEQVDHRTDIWSIGALLYEALTGVRPFDAPYESAVFYAIINVDPVSLSEHLEDVPYGLQEIVGRCLQKDPADRYQSASELASDLRDVLTGELEFHESGDRTASILRPRARRIMAVTLTLAVAVIFILTVQPVRDAILSGPEQLPRMLGVTVLPDSATAESLKDDPFAIGLIHVVSSALAALEQFHPPLWVVTYRNNILQDYQSALDVANEVYVNLVVRPKVRWTEEQIHVTLELVDIRNDNVLRTEQFNLNLEEGTDYRTRIAEKLGDLLGVDLDREAKRIVAKGGTTNSAAFRYYAEGLGLHQARSRQSEVEASVSLFEQAVQLDSTFAFAHTALGSLYRQMFTANGDSSWAKLADKSLGKAIASDPSLASAHVSRGYLLSLLGRVVEAEDEYRQALDLDGSRTSAYQLLGFLLDSQNRFSEEEETFLSSIDYKPNYWRFNNWLGMLYDGQLRREDAAEQFARVVELTPENAWGYNNLAVQYKLLGREVEAESLYMKATVVNLSAASARTLAYFNLGEMSYGRDDFEGAEAMFRQSLALDSVHFDAWDGLGNCLHWLGEADDATEAWMKVVDLVEPLVSSSSPSGESLEDLATAYAKLGLQEQALATISRWESLGPFSQSEQLKLGIAYEIMGLRDMALANVNRALEDGYDLVTIQSSRWLDDLRGDRRYECHFSGDPCLY